MENQKGIYRIKNNVNGKSYIGSASNFNVRLDTHFSQLAKNKHYNKEMQYDWNKYGGCNFSISILEHLDDESLYPKIEKQYIELYNEHRGVYNYSDPTNEDAQYHRYKKLSRVTKKNKIKDKNTYTYTKKVIEKYIDDTFSKLILIMNEKVNDKKYFNKNKLFKWMLNQIDDVNIANDDRIQEVIIKFFNKNHYKIISADGYKMHINYLYKINVTEENEDIIINLQSWEEIKNRKQSIINKERYVID